MFKYIYKLLSKPQKLDTKRVTECMVKYRRGQGHRFIIPNMYIHTAYEIDVMSTKGRSLHDDEVKVSRGDFFRDLKKGKHGLIMRGRYPANYFSYVCPSGLIKPSEVPEYAGLYWVNQFGSVRMKKKPVRINRKPQRDKYLLKIAGKLDKMRA